MININKVESCVDTIGYKGHRNHIGRRMFLQGRIVLGYPKINKLDYKRGYPGNINSNNDCKKVKTLGEFIIYLFDGNKNINQWTIPNDLNEEMYKEYEQNRIKFINERNNKLLVKNIKKLFVFILKTISYEILKNKCGDK